MAKNLDTLQQSLAMVIDKATAGVEAGVDFLSAQLPDVIHQLLMWKAVESFLMFSLSLALFVVIGIMWRYVYKFEKKNADRISVSGSGIFFGGLMTCALGAVALCSFSITWLQIWIAPKIYLIEYASKLIAGK
jgi:hypothetical protein